MNRSILLLTVLCAVACDDKDTDTDTSKVTVEPTDADNDGYISVADGGDDCDDADSAVHPDADETCDGIDNNCDDVVDTDAIDQGTFYADGDGDGFGDAAVDACERPDGHVEVDGDCDDSDDAYHPGAAEDDCTDPNDYNCDGSVSFEDADGDGWAACTECNDADADISPDAAEICDAVDNDCDGTVDGKIATFVNDSGAWSDATDDLTGSFSSPADMELTEAGTLYICEGEWFAHLSLESDVSVVGVHGAESTVVSGGELDSVVRIESDGIVASVSGLTLTGGLGTTDTKGSSLSSGGGLYCNADVDLTLDDIFFVDNVADNGAGANLSGFCDTTISNSTFSGGQATYGGGLTIIYATAVLDNVDFTENSATNAHGGGGIRLSSVGVLEMTGGTLSKNSAPRGGGIYNNGGTASYDGVTFSENTAGAHGGGLYTQGSDDLTDCDFTDNTATSGGGGIVANQSTVTISGGTVSGNTAAHGGGISVNGSTLSATSTTFDSNAASGADGGGGAYFFDSTAADLDSCTFSSNTALLGGGISVSDATLDLTDVDLDANTATDASGGGIHGSSGASIDMASGSFTNNTAVVDGGGVFLTASTASFDGTSFEANTAGDDAGALMAEASSDVELDSCTIDANEAGDNGGAIYLYTSTGDITDSTLSNNLAADYGGAIMLYDTGVVTISDSIIEDNTATNDLGGGIRVGIDDSMADGDNVDFSGNAPDDVSVVYDTEYTFGKGEDFTCVEGDGC